MAWGKMRFLSFHFNPSQISNFSYLLYLLYLLIPQEAFLEGRFSFDGVINGEDGLEEAFFHRETHGAGDLDPLVFIHGGQGVAAIFQHDRNRPAVGGAA